MALNSASLGAGDRSIKIAILDGVVDIRHPSLAGAQIDLVASMTVAGAGSGGGQAGAHGTHVASIIFGQPGSGVAGIAPRCSGLAIPIFSDHPQQPIACSQLDLARAISLAVDRGAHVINISGGQLTKSAQPEPLLANVLERCAKANVLVVAAAGNDGCDCLHVPAASDVVLAVGAMDQQGQPLPSSNWGAAYRNNGVLALGVSRGAGPDGSIIQRAGTSFATAHVSGIAGLLLSLQVANGQPPDPGAVRRAILASATPCSPVRDGDCRKLLAGRLNFPAAVTIITNGGQDMLDVTTPASPVQPSHADHDEHDLELDEMLKASSLPDRRQSACSTPRVRTVWLRRV